MSHRSQRREGQRQQKQQKQEHMPRQRAQRRQREQRDQRQWQGRRERLEKRREKREKERSREAVQETIYNVYTENQTDLPHPFRQEPQIEHFPGPQVEHVQELQVEHAQEPRVQRLPPLGNARFWVSLLSLGFLLGYWIGRAVARRAPRAAEAFHLAIRVSALETGRFVFSSLNQLARAWAHAVSTNGGFVEYVVLLVMLVLLIGHYGNMYLGRGEPAEDNPDRGRDSEESSDNDFYSVTDRWTNEGTPQEPWVQEPDSDSDSISGDIVARAA